MTMPKGSWSQKKFFRDIVVRKNNPNQNDGITKLSDVLLRLPCGIVFKDETGMGATTLELKAKRNSIIVEPIKITASSKAHKYKKKKAIYVGSPTNYHPDKIEDEDIYKYLLNPKIKFKKIVVVADSLGRIIDAILVLDRLKALDETEEKIKAIAELNGIKKETILQNIDDSKNKKNLRKYYNYSLLNNYFLLIDEIDSFQLDSSYRRSMEDCLDYYKLFRKDKRCMLSATDIMFTDPELQDEEITYIRYNIPSKREINIITSGGKQLLGKAYDRIVESLKRYPKDKILVAYNTVNGCYNLSEKIRNDEVVKEEEIAILCSIQSKDRVNNYFKELDSDILPAKLNFITSAYFTGFDLHERFHLISISGNRSNAQALSERRLKQIAGRCRNGLKSETIIHDIVVGGIFRTSKRNTTLNEVTFEKVAKQKIIKKDPTKNDLINAAREQLRSLDCMNKHYRSNKLLHEILEDVNDKFMRLLDDKQMRFVRRDRKHNLKISYLNIDAKLESIRVKKELYLYDDALTLKLKANGHNVKIIKRYKATEISSSEFSYEGKNYKVKQIIEQLKQIKSSGELSEYLKDNNLTPVQKTIVRDFKKLYGYLEPVSLLNKMQENLIDRRDNRKYNSLLISAQFQTLPDGHIVVDRLKYYFEVGKRYTPIEIFKRMTIFLLEIGYTKKIKNETEAVKILNNFRKTYKKKDEKDGVIYRHIKNDNPEKIICILKRNPLEQIDLL